MTVGRLTTHTSLPIDAVIPQLLETVKMHNTTIIHAPPGAGKTTRVPLALLDSVPAKAGRILMLEPRRIAAVSAAYWMAASLGEEVGQTVGYSIRFDSKVSAATRIEVVTEGILTRRIQNDPGLDGVAVVIFDEFHERSIHADLGLVLCREVQQLRPELILLIMSATLDLAGLAQLLDNAPLLSSSGRCFPVEIHYGVDATRGKLTERVAIAVRKALRDTEGDILAFLPGAGEIRYCAAALSGNDSVDVMSLYGDLPISEQQKVLQVGKRRKIVLATTIAETSVTIEGVRVVIDSGVTRRLHYDAGSGLNKLVTVRESRSSAEQRAGRGGRTAPGICYRLFSQHTFNAMSAHTPPEIMVTELSSLLLELSAWGVKEPEQLQWLDAPPTAGVVVARRLLGELELLDGRGDLTAYGHEAVRLPLHPRLARLLLRSRELGCLPLGCHLAALLSEKDVVRRDAGLTQHRIASSSDILDRLDMVVKWNRSGAAGAMLDFQATKNMLRVADNLARLMKCSEHKLMNIDEELTARMLLAAYPDRLARRREAGSNSYLLANGRGACLSEHSAVTLAEYLLAVTLDNGTQAEARIHLASEIAEHIIRDECRSKIVTEEQVFWDARETRVVASRVERLGSVRLASQLCTPSAVLAVPAVIEAVRASNLTLLTMNEQVRQLQGRLRLIKTCFSEQQWSEISDTALMAGLDEWLAPHVHGVYTARKLATLNIAEILWQQFDYKQQREIDRLAPTSVMVPSGSRIRIDYTQEKPVLAVKLQELFGLATGPALCDGKMPVLLHLLSPAGRPIQVTADLRGFWDGSYVQVKKELKGRYPKHPWPDDPWSAIPTRKAKPRG